MLTAGTVLSTYTHYLVEFLQHPLEAGSVPPRDEETPRGSHKFEDLTQAIWLYKGEDLGFKPSSTLGWAQVTYSFTSSSSRPQES